MAFFPRAFINSEASFAPFFRVLEDFESHTRAQAPRVISPKFDVQEHRESYELHGEFPGFSQDNISLEFTDAQTLTVRAHHEAESEKSNTPVAEAPQVSASVTDTDAASTHSQQPTVEDASEDGVIIESPTPASTEAQEPASTLQNQPAQPQTQRPRAQYYVRERSIGDFYRQFSFPGRIDQEAVTASMKNGILSVIVPKAKKYESRRIAIN